MFTVFTWLLILCLLTAALITIATAVIGEFWPGRMEHFEVVFFLVFVYSVQLITLSFCGMVVGFALKLVGGVLEWA